VALKDEQGSESNWFPITLVEGSSTKIISISPSSMEVDGEGRVLSKKNEQKVHLMVQNLWPKKVKKCRFGNKLTAVIKSTRFEVVCRLPERISLEEGTEVEVSVTTDERLFIGGKNGAIMFRFEIPKGDCSPNDLCEMGQVCNNQVCEPQSEQVLVFSSFGKCESQGMIGSSQRCFDEKTERNEGQVGSSSLKEAMKEVREGDVILVDEGVYCGGFSIESSYVTLKSLNENETVIVNCEEPVGICDGCP